MKLKITTLVIVEEGQVLDIFHSLKDNQENAEHEIIDMVEEEYGDEDENIHFKSIQDIEDYFEIVHIQILITTQTQVQSSTSTYVPKTN